MKQSIFLICTLLVFGCNQPKSKPIDILHPNFNLTFDKLVKDGFCHMPEDVPILGKHIGDTLLYYQFDDFHNLIGKSKPIYMFCEFPISSINIDSVEYFLTEKKYFKVCECQNDNSFETFYVKHQFKNFIYQCTVDKNNYTLSLSYNYPQIDD